MRAGAFAAGLLGAGFAAYVTALYLGLPDPRREPAPMRRAAGRADWPESAMPDPDAWSVVRAGAPEEEGPAAAAGNRFRLVGTYFMLPPSAEIQPVRKAVLDDLREQSQALVEEGTVIDGHTVRQIHRDWVLLALPDGRQVELRLRFGPGAVEAPGEGPPAAAAPAWDDVTLEESRFGRRIAEDRWILRRDELVAYREELLDDPERLAALFLSMKATRADNKVTGYRLEQQGEQAFWAAVGLRESDVIRRANSMEMTRQARAEYLISEFVANRLNVVVLDIERDGNPQKLIYYLRE